MDQEKFEQKGRRIPTLFGEAPPEVSIVIPCYNEADGIVQTVETVRAYCRKELPEFSFEYIIVDDGSLDNSLQKLHELQQTYEELRVVAQGVNKGRGAALRSGIKESRGDYVITLDADLSYDVDHIRQILGEFGNIPSTDAVLVSPYMKGGYVEGVPFTRLLISRAANWILSGFFENKVSTVTCVARGYKGEVIRALPLFESNKEFHLEVLRKLVLCGAKILETPGRLIWKEKKKRAARKGGIRIFSAARKHIFYAFLVRPTRLFKYIAGFLLFIALYEFFLIGASFFAFYEAMPGEFSRSIWLALSRSFRSSPHSFYIAGLSLVLSVQAFSYLAILRVLKLQQGETLRHLIAVLQPKITGPNPELSH